MKHSNIFYQKWQFYISRNLPIWHDSLAYEFFSMGFKRYKINKSYDQCRVHRSFCGDFYSCISGNQSVEDFKDELSKKLSDPKYLQFLKIKYKKDLTKFLSLSKKINTDYKTLKLFFIF